MFSNILLPIDLEEEAPKKAISLALQHCRDHGAKLHVLAVVPGFSMSIVSQYFPKDFENRSLKDAAKRLEIFIKDKISPEMKVQAIIANGTVYEEILKVAAQNGCDLIIVTAHRPDLKDFLLGPNAARVVRHAKCSVTVVRD